MSNYIDEEISQLVQNFALAMNELKLKMKQYLSTYVQSLKNSLVQSYVGLDMSQLQMKDLLQMISDVQNKTNEMVELEATGKRVQGEIQNTFNLIQENTFKVNNVTFVSQFNDAQDQQWAVLQVQQLNLQEKEPINPNIFNKQEINKKQIPNIKIVPNLIDHNHLQQNYCWSSTLKHMNTNIFGLLTENPTLRYQMILIEPSFNTQEVRKVRLFMRELSQALVSLCHLEKAKSAGSTWDHRLKVGQGVYSHKQDGSIIPYPPEHQQINNQKNGFKYQKGDLLEIEWNGPLRQFSTCKLSTQEKFAQTINFEQNVVLNFGIQIARSSVKIVQ